MKRVWHFLVNQMLNVALSSFKLAMKLSNYHDAFLLGKMTNEPGEPDWATLYNRYNPFHVTLYGAFTNWKSGLSIQEGQTLSTDQLLDQLVNKVDDWEYDVIGVYKKDTPEFKAIFADGRAPFARGGKDDRIAAVETLSKNIGNDAALATVKTDVDDFYNLLNTSRDSQESKKGNTRTLSVVLRQAITAAMDEQYRNLGFLMNKYATSRNLIGPFFELNLLRRHIQTLFTGTMIVGETAEVLIHTFLEDDEIRIKIIGPGPVKFYLATTPSGLDSTAVTANGNAEVTILASAFAAANYGTHRYLTAVNESGASTQYEVELL